VLRLGVEGPEYAAHLLDLARAFQQHRAPVLPAPAMARPSSLERRVRAMLNDRLNRNPTTRTACVAVVIALVALALPIASFVASAQATLATFSGSLVDAVGHVLPNTALTLSNLATNETHESTSDQTGSFTFSGLAAGAYQIQVTLTGFDKAQGRITLAAGQTLNRDVALQIGEIEESVTVSSAAVPSANRARAAMALPPYQPGTDRCSQSAIGGCIVAPVPLSHTDPVYPPEQRDNGVSGRVKMAGRIGTDGFVKDLRLAAPADPAFVNATVEALRQWQYAATRLDGVPMETNIQVTVNFIVQ
jgi:TonB family protein